MSLSHPPLPSDCVEELGHDHLNEISRQIAILSTQLEALWQRLEDPASSTASPRPFAYSTNYSHLELDIPRFEGTGSHGWIIKVSQYFAYHQTPEEERLAIASSYLEGAALAWYQWMYRNHQITSWAEFLCKLEIRFPSVHGAAYSLPSAPTGASDWQFVSHSVTDSALDSPTSEETSSVAADASSLCQPLATEIPKAIVVVKQPGALSDEEPEFTESDLADASSEQRRPSTTTSKKLVTFSDLFTATTLSPSLTIAAVPRLEPLEHASSLVIIAEDDAVSLPLIGAPTQSLIHTYPYDPGPFNSPCLFLTRCIDFEQQWFSIAGLRHSTMSPPPPKPPYRRFQTLLVEVQVTSDLTMPPPPSKPPDINNRVVHTIVSPSCVTITTCPQSVWRNACVKGMELCTSFVYLNFNDVRVSGKSHFNCVLELNSLPGLFYNNSTSNLLEFLHTHTRESLKLMINDRTQIISIFLSLCVKVQDSHSKFANITPFASILHSICCDTDWGNVVVWEFPLLYLLQYTLHAHYLLILENFYGAVVMVFSIVELFLHFYFGLANALGLFDKGEHVLYKFDLVASSQVNDVVLVAYAKVDPLFEVGFTLLYPRQNAQYLLELATTIGHNYDIVVLTVFSHGLYWILIYPLLLSCRLVHILLRQGCPLISLADIRDTHFWKVINISHLVSITVASLGSLQSLGNYARDPRPWQIPTAQKLHFSLEQLMPCLVAGIMFGSACFSFAHYANRGTGSVITMNLWLSTINDVGMISSIQMGKKSLQVVVVFEISTLVSNCSLQNTFLLWLFILHELQHHGWVDEDTNSCALCSRLIYATSLVKSMICFFELQRQGHVRAALATAPSHGLHHIGLKHGKITSFACVTYGCMEVCLDILICCFDTLWQGWRLTATSCKFWVCEKTFYNLEDKVGLHGLDGDISRSVWFQYLLARMMFHNEGKFHSGYSSNEGLVHDILNSKKHMLAAYLFGGNTLFNSVICLYGKGKLSMGVVNASIMRGCYLLILATEEAHAFNCEFSIFQLAEFIPWDPGGHFQRSKILWSFQSEQWDPGKFFHRENFYNLEDKVGLDGVDIDTYGDPGGANIDEGSGPSNADQPKVTIKRDQRDKRIPARFKDHVLYR